MHCFVRGWKCWFEEIAFVCRVLSVNYHKAKGGGTLAINRWRIDEDSKDTGNKKHDEECGM